MAMIIVILLLFSSFQIYYSIITHERHDRLVEIGQHDLNTLENEFKDSVKHFKLDMITTEGLISIFDNSENNKLKYFVVDTYQNTKEFYHFSNFIDDALLSRPWITIKKFVYKLNTEHNVVLHHIIFEKLFGKIEKAMRLIADNNYPASQEICASRPLYIVDVDGDTWGNRAYNIGGRVQRRDKFVKLFFITGNTPYASNEECTNKINKYECIFMPSTNCKIPESFYGGKRGEHFYTKAALDGVVIGKDKLPSYEQNELKNAKSFILDGDMEKSEHTLFTIGSKYHYLNTKVPVEINDATTATQKGGVTFNTVGLKYVFGYVHRPNTEFRLKIQHYVDKFRASTHPTFLSNSSCVFAHIRKDDRALPHVEMVEWCYNHTRKKKGESGYEWYGKRDFYPNSPEDELSFGGWMDKGCQTGISINTYQHVLKLSFCNFSQY